jgi:sulfite reductase (NADPH) flavoprotein alpha-component
MSQNTYDIPEEAPFDARQREALGALQATLNPAQAAWLSGYFAGLGQLRSGGGTATGTLPTEAGAEGAMPLTILYGSESGNAEGCAQLAAEAAGREGFAVTVADMGDYDRSRLAGETNLLVVVSTWGEGDPPETAVDFHEFVMGEATPKLEGTRFAVFALGDTSYADFCECGKQFDQRLAALGGKRVLDRVDSDVDYEEPFNQWLGRVMPAMRAAAGTSAGSGVVAPAGQSPAVPAAPAETYGKKNPFPAPIKTLINLNGRGSAKETYHIELSLAGSGMSYEPGDVLGVVPENCPETVEDLLKLTGFSGDESVEEGEGATPLRDALRTRYDITSLNPSLMKKYAALANNPELDRFLEPENKGKVKDWLWGRETRDLFQEFPPAERLGTEQLLGMLRKMPPRLYSIASSLRAHPEEVHLTVGAVLYNTHGRDRKGVCSTFLGHRVAVGDTVKVYTHHNKNFFLPENSDTPIIMVGPGTAIAPFRAFIEERQILGAKGRNWLFFGDQHFNSDFLYQTEWQKYLKNGMLTRMDVAFSRDTDHKIYVQHRMMEQARDIYAWMKEGAFFYVCGDASRMAKDVHQALIDIYAQEGAMARDAAETEVKELQKSKRYQRDVY